MNRLKLANSVTFDRMERTLRHVRKAVLPDTLAVQAQRTIPAGPGITAPMRPLAPDAAVEPVAPSIPAAPAAPSVSNATLIRTLLGLEEPLWLDEVPRKSTKSDVSAEGSSTASNDIEWFGGALNDSQKEAITFCLKAQSVACIHGPPGVSLPATESDGANDRLGKPIPLLSSSFSSSRAQSLKQKTDHLEY